MNEDPKLDKLMSLYHESADTNADDNTELGPIFSGLLPAPTPFTQETLIARGGMKTILKVYDPKTARYVALARLNLDSPEELYEPFLREARLTALLDHPNIITILDIGLNTDKTPWFTMELKTGQSLDQIIKEQFTQPASSFDNETIANLLNIFLKVCDAMDYAHSQNVVHLDLKPQNIQVGQHGEVIVCDWGLGKLIGNKDYDGGDFDRLLLNPDLLNNMTLTGQIRGTPGFMAPEQAAKDQKTSIQTDIYALGAILYTMLTNHIPVDGDSDNDLLNNTTQGHIVPLDQRCPSHVVPPALAAIARKAMATEPSLRYSSVRALQDDLISYQHGFSTSAENAGFLKELRLFYGRQKKSIHISAFFLLVLMGAVTTAFISIHRSEQNAITARDQLEQEKEQRLYLGREASPQYYDRAVTALSQGQEQEAFTNLQTAIVLNPHYVDAHNLLASLYFMRGLHTEAANTFWEYPQSIFRKLHDLNHILLDEEPSSEQEYQQVEELLTNCGQIVSTPLTTALFVHWALDDRPEYRELAFENFKVHKEITPTVLALIMEQKSHPGANILLQRILQSLQASPNWIGRRIPATMGMNFSTDLTMHQQFQALIPSNLALGQSVSTTGGYRSNPSHAVDGDPNTYWSAAPYPAEIVVDLGDVHVITQIKIVANDFASQAKNFMYDLLVTTGKYPFNSLGWYDQNTHKHETSLTYTISPTAVRKIRFKVNYHEGSIPICIKEIEVY